jgi:CHAT domain-containing protein
MNLIATLITGFLLFQNGLIPSSTEQNERMFQRLFSQASLLRAQGDFEAAADVIQKALSISRQIKLCQGERKCLVRMGILKWDLGDISMSSNYFAEALEAYQQAYDKRSAEFCSKCIELIHCYNQGKEGRTAKLYHRSLGMFERALALGREIGFPDFSLKCLRQQAATYWEMGRLDLFLANNKKGLDLSTRLNHKIEKSRCLNNIGVYHQKQNDFSLAVDNIETALSIARSGNNPETEAECLSNLGILYRDLGNLTRAQFCLSKALEIDKKRENTASISMDLNNIGSLYLRRGLDNKTEQDLVEALATFQKCLSIQAANGSNTYLRFSALSNIGIILNELGNHSNARNYFALAMDQIDDKKDMTEKCHLLSNIAASFMFENKFESALENYHLSYELGLRNSLENAVMESCLGLGQCYENKNEYSKALSFYRRSIEAMEKMRSRISTESFLIGFARNKLSAYQRVVNILARQYAAQPSFALLENMYACIESAKARAFREGIYEARVDIGEVLYSGLKERQKAISRHIYEIVQMLATKKGSAIEKKRLNNELEQEEEEYVRVLSEMKNKGEMYDKKNKKEICSILEVQKRIIDKNTVLLEYFLGDEESYLIVISTKSAELYLLPRKTEIEKSLRAYLKMISDHSIDKKEAIAASSRIGHELLPMMKSDELESAKAMIIIPDGILHYLPFEALEVSDENVSKYLIERTAVSYCPSASALYFIKTEKKEKKWKKELLAIGAPNYEFETDRVEGAGPRRNSALLNYYNEQGFGLSPLPYSKKEITDVVKLFSGVNVQILMDKEANEENLKKLPLIEYRVIHFACHGFLDERYPFRSALVLSLGGQQEDEGFLQMREIYGLANNADLVVLSACQTGQGPLEMAEGPMGLVRAFFFAGAKSVIASLWAINDRSTAELMRELYKNLVRGQNVGEALRSSKIKMINSMWNKPCYWAGFLLQGNSSLLGFNSPQ